MTGNHPKSEPPGGDDSAPGDLAAPDSGRSGLRALFMRAIERTSGLHKIRPLYDIWRRDVAGKNPRMMNEALAMLGTRLNISAPQWPVALPASQPLIMIANHPFGIGDGIAALALAEDLGRPFRVLLNQEFLRIPEIRPLALPIDFSESREALATNIATRNEARALLKQGVTMVIFPAGGVATARLPWGMADELPWKAFTARLVQMSRASVLPVYFHGQNSAMFHLLSRISPSLRMSLLVSEFRRFAGHTIDVSTGAHVAFEALNHGDDRALLNDELRALVFALAPATQASSAQANAAKERPPWDRPVATRRRT